jgi:hypothetical protein
MMLGVEEKRMGMRHAGLSGCRRPKLLSAQIRMSGCLSAARMASGRTLAAGRS